MKKKAAGLKDWVEKQEEEELPQFGEEGEEEEDTEKEPNSEISLVFYLAPKIPY